MFHISDVIFMFLIIIIIILIIYNNKLTIKNNNTIEKDKDNINIDINLNEDNFLEEKIERRLEPPTYIHEDVRYVPINIRTRGMPTDYQQIGILTNINNPNDVRPLYARQTYSGSNKWNYYSSLDSNLSTKIPIFKDNIRCTDEYGCKEIYDNDIVLIGNVSSQKYILTKYSTDSFRYIPDII